LQLFGEISRIENSNFYEIDSFIISNKKVHDNFISYLQTQFEKENFMSIVFETITEISKNYAKINQKTPQKRKF